MAAQSYITQRQHMKYPAGTRCMADRSFDGRTIFLEFDDGTVISLMGSRFYLKGLESTPNGPQTIADEEDKATFDAIEHAMGGR